MMEPGMKVELFIKNEVKENEGREERARKG